MSSRLRSIVSALVVVALLSACGSDSGSSLIEIGLNGELDGLLTIEQGVCGKIGPETGSWFRMIEPGGNIQDGPFVTNFDSICSDQSYSTLSPGTLGLRAGVFQKHPEPAFDAATNGLATEIIGPTRFYSVNFALGSEELSPLTGDLLPPPKFTAVNESGNEDSIDWTLKASLESLYIAWNGDFIEQGAPHPEGFVGATTDPRGTINLSTGRFLLRWTSQVEGGAFDGFIGQWHLEGVYVPADRIVTDRP